jgi:hypothetical protein
LNRFEKARPGAVPAPAVTIGINTLTRRYRHTDIAVVYRPDPCGLTSADATKTEFTFTAE